MEKSTVEKFASELNLPIDLLLKQLESAGIKKTSGAEELLEEDKSALLNYLQIEHGASNTSKNNANIEVRFSDVFPVSLTGLEFNQQANDIDYLTATVTMKYKIYEFVSCS